jgi:hypothetical protein
MRVLTRFVVIGPSGGVGAKATPISAMIGLNAYLTLRASQASDAMRPTNVASVGR